MAKIPTIPRIPEDTDTITLDGGMDLVTPKIAMKPGRVVAGENWEVNVNTGYGRVVGYERTDGHVPAPSDAVIHIVGVEEFQNIPAIGAFLEGQTSLATGYVASLGGTFINLHSVTGTFDVPEVVVVGATVIGTTVDPPFLTGLDRAIHTAEVADIARADIEAVPGSGPGRGAIHAVFAGVDQIYAFRDNVGATAKELYKQTASGWEQVDFYNEVSFNTGGTGVPADGNTLTMGGVTATIKRVMLESGSWAAGTAAGRLVITTPAGGNFSAGAATAGSVNVTLAGIETAITLVPGGKFNFFKHNFAGSGADQKIYGADGAGQLIEFDGDVLLTIATGSVPDTPSCVLEYLGYLVVAIGSSILYSGPGTPYIWTAAGGAGEIAVGDRVTNLAKKSASQTASALGVYCTKSTQFLFGKSPSDWSMDPYKDGVGAYPFTAQTLDHDYVFHHIGLIDYRAAENFGNFVQSSLTVNMQPLINTLRSAVACSTVERSKSQYRIFFTDGTGIYATIVNGRFRGAMPVRLAHVPYMCSESILANGDPINLMTSATDGMVYRMEKGTSFDGEAIAAPMLLGWYYGKHARMIKRWRRVMVEIESSNVVQFNLGHNLRYGDTQNVPQPRDQEVVNEAAGVPFWDDFVWDEFVWDGSDPIPTVHRIDSSSVNIQFSLTSVSKYLPAFTVSALLVDYSNRRKER